MYYCQHFLTKSASLEETIQEKWKKKKAIFLNNGRDDDYKGGATTNVMDREMQEIWAATAPPPYLSQLLQKELSPASFHNAALSSSVFFLPYSFLLHQSANAFLSWHLALPAFIFFIQLLQQTYLALVLQIALVSCNHYGNVISAPDAVDEFLVCNNFIEAASISDGVTNDKSLSFAHVLLSHSCKLWLKRQKKTKKSGNYELRLHFMW